MHDSTNYQNSKQSLYPFNTFLIRPEFRGCPLIADTPFDPTEHEKAYEENEQFEFGLNNGG